MEIQIDLLNLKDIVYEEDDIPFEFLDNFFYQIDKKNYLPVYWLLYKFLDFLIYIYNNYFLIFIKKKYLLICIKYLKFSSILKFKILVDLVVTDSISFSWNKRFKLTYQLLSFKYNNRLFLNTFTDIKENISSLYLLFPNSNWLEREAWDLFGLVFINHPDLRRILTDYGFRGYPLRKDFPVSGYIELWYDDRIQDITYRPIKLMQEMRFYNFVNTWENLL